MDITTKNTDNMKETATNQIVQAAVKVVSKQVRPPKCVRDFKVGLKWEENYLEQIEMCEHCGYIQPITTLNQNKDE